MIDNILQLVRSNIQKLKPYQSARRIGNNNGKVLLNANESPKFSIFQIKKKIFNRYPSPQPFDLIKIYSKYIDIPCENILITRGADEGIGLLMQAFCNPGKDAIIYCPPTYDMYGISANILGIEIKEIPLIQNTWKLNLSTIESSLNRVKIIYICNPNNPTGNIISQHDILHVLKITEHRAVVVIDEAYIEFIPQESMTSILKKFANLVILRTLSKAFALSGIRCGFTLAHKEIICILNKIINPYPISAPVTDIAIQSLHKSYVKLMKQRVLYLNKNRVWLTHELKKMPCVKHVFNSEANYVLVRFFMYEKIFKYLWNNGIIVRDQTKKVYLQKCLRISIGTKKECLQFMQALKNYLK